MKQFDDSFYTDDFDQEMLDWLIKEDYTVVSGNSKLESPDASDNCLAYGKIFEYFWTGSLSPSTFKHLTKQQFKDKIGMPDTKTNQEKIFKLIDRGGYLDSHYNNRQTLSDCGVFVDGNYYFKGEIDTFSRLKSSGKEYYPLIGLSEFKYFEEVDSIPLPNETSEKNESLLVNSYINLAELSEEISENVTPKNETIVQRVFDLCKEYSADFSYYSGVLRIYIGEDEILIDNEDKLDKIRTFFKAKKDLFD